jgi:hypothetical protein
MGGFGKVVASILVAAGAVALTLIGVLGLGRVAMRVSLVANPALHAAGTIAELAAEIIWLLGTVYLVTRLAVVIFAEPNQPSTNRD